MLKRPHTRILLWLSLSWLTVAGVGIALGSDLAGMEEAQWLERANQLIAEAERGRAQATQFNLDVRDSRTQLRQVIQQDRAVDLSAEHRALHSNMVLLDVLLKSAAACQTAGYIACPPLLMSQLKTVMKNAYTNLDKVKQTHD